MSRLKGIPVILIDKVFVENDAFDRPIYKDVEKTIDNVLVAPVNSTDILNQLNITGSKAVYVLAIPKGDTNIWQGKEVIFFDKKWKVCQHSLQGIDELIPLKWNKKVMVELYE